VTLEFVESAVFTARVERLGLEVSLRGLQNELLANPEAGRLDPGTGGLRKIRIPAKSRGKGKRGGARVHCLYLPHVARIYLMFVFAKDEDDTLTPEQKKAFSKIVRAIKAES
jgi:hypothetical protein